MLYDQGGLEMKIENLRICNMLENIGDFVVSRDTLTGYASIDDPHMRESTFFEKHPFIPNMNIYTVLKFLSGKYLDNTIKMITFVQHL